MLFFWVQLYAQNFADKKHYLIDSLEINKLSSYEKKLIDSSLQVFHTTKLDTVKAKTINNLVAYLANDEIWSQYNNWLYNFSSQRINSISLTKQEISLYINLKALSLNNLGVSLRSKAKYNRALKIYFESLAILKRIDDKHGQGNVLNNIGTIYKDIGKIPEALEYYQKSLALKEEVGNRKGVAYTINNIAIIYRSLGDINKALENYLNCLNILESVSDKKGIAVVLNNVATIYQKQENYKTAKEYFERSLGMHQEINNKKAMGITLVHLASIYEKEGDKAKCIEYYQKSLLLNKEIKNASGIASCLRNLGAFHLRNNNHDKVLLLLNESLDILNSINEVEGQIHTLNVLAKYFLAKNDINEAKKNALKSLSLAKKLGFPAEIKAAAMILTHIYEKGNNWSLAYEAQKLFIIMQDSIKSKSIHESILKQKAKYDINKKEQEIKVLSIQNESLKKDKEIQELRINKNRLTIILISIALLVTLLFVAFNLKWNKKKKKIYKLLKKQKEEISLKNDEKTAMLQEIHHRVKNNLQVVNSLLRFQSREIKDKNVLAIFEKAQKRVVSMALLHEKMYNSDDLKHVDVKEYISLLIADLIETYSVGKKIRQNIQIEDVHFEMRTLVPLGLIINEIITNSLKHAFIDLLEGEIKIHIKQLKNNAFEMLIGDDGIGSVVARQSGLGNKLIHIFVKQLDGTIELLKESGTVYRIVFEEID